MSSPTSARLARSFASRPRREICWTIGETRRRLGLVAFTLRAARTVSIAFAHLKHSLSSSKRSDIDVSGVVSCSSHRSISTRTVACSR